MTTVYVGNLPSDAREDTLRRIFGRFGHVSSVRLVKPQVTRHSRSYGLIEMSEPQAAVKAAQDLNGQYFRGLFLRVRQVESSTH